MIHIADTKVARRYGDFFIRQIHKFEEVGDDHPAIYIRTKLFLCLTWMGKGNLTIVTNI